MYKFQEYMRRLWVEWACRYCKVDIRSYDNNVILKMRWVTKYTLWNLVRKVRKKSDNVKIFLMKGLIVVNIDK